LKCFRCGDVQVAASLTFATKQKCRRCRAFRW
jgi:hypothetical protein